MGKLQFSGVAISGLPSVLPVVVTCSKDHVRVGKPGVLNFGLKIQFHFLRYPLWPILSTNLS